MNYEYARAFVIGSSCLVFLPFFYVVSRFKPEYFNFDYVLYTFLAPIALGLMNVISLFLAKIYNLSRRNRFLLASLIAPTIVLLTVFIFGIYNYNQSQWLHHIIGVYLMYFFVFNVILYSLELYV